MNENKIEEIAEALYHPEHIADDLDSFIDVEETDLDKLIVIVFEHLKMLVRDCYNNTEFKIDRDMIDNCGVELTADELYEFRKYIIKLQFSVGDELDYMVDENR
jgi:hypothetical protein